MSRSLTFFNRWVFPAVLLAGMAVPSQPSARVFLNQQEALARVFPGDREVARRTEFLTEEQAVAIGELSGEELDSRVVTYYVGVREGGEKAMAFFDTHRVRSLPETVLILVGPDGKVIEVMVLSFLEPPDYLPRSKWFQQFQGRGLDPGLSLKAGIHSITGATLSARAVTRAVRRVLAIHRVLNRSASEPPGAAGGSAGGIR